LNTDGLFMEDGSGLSHFDAVSAEQFTKALAIMHKENLVFNDFYNSLPVAGRSGSIANICKGTEAEGNLCAKSGYMNRVRSYVGYVKNKKGELLAFAFLINNYTESSASIKRKIEKLLVALAG
jgi:serine-type D-Ala-D-Ala carboxypeptidase/endopeptidase (penicillin-binding protein 4)